MIKKYNTFLESKKELSIYDWFYMMHDGDMSNYELYANRFIGDGYADKVKNTANEIYSIIAEVIMEDIDAMLVDLYDIASLNYSRLCILTSDYTEPNEYNGAQFFRDINELKDDIICLISKSIVYPTLTYYERNSQIDNRLRTTPEMIYVTNSKYNCKNFKTSDYNPIDLNFYTKKKLERYDVDLIIDSFKAGIVINLGDDKFSAEKLVNIDDVEEVIESKEPMIIDYLEDLAIKPTLIYDFSKGKRQFTTKVFSEYSLKILLEK